MNATTSHGLQITSSLTFSLHWFIDADCDGSVDDRKSTSYYLVYLSTTPISWKFMKQKIIALSFTKTKYKALGDGIIEVLWTRSFLSKFQLSPVCPAILWCDNLGSIYLFMNSIFHALTKYVEVKYHLFVIELLKKSSRFCLFLPRLD